MKLPLKKPKLHNFLELWANFNNNFDDDTKQSITTDNSFGSFLNCFISFLVAGGLNIWNK